MKKAALLLRIFTWAICLVTVEGFAQLPTVKAFCGEGRNVDWPKIKAEVEKEEMTGGMIVNILQREAGALIRRE